MSDTYKEGTMWVNSHGPEPATPEQLLACCRSIIAQARYELACTILRTESEEARRILAAFDYWLHYPEYPNGLKQTEADGQRPKPPDYITGIK